jgi:hypothetical protein
MTMYSWSKPDHSDLKELVGIVYFKGEEQEIKNRDKSTLLQSSDGGMQFMVNET